MTGFDVVIVGGAAVGSSVAYHLLADRGFSGTVAVIECDPGFGRAASALSASGIRQQFTSAVNIEVSLFGIAFLRGAEDELAVGDDRPALSLKEGGYLTLCSPAGEAALRRAHALQVAHGADIALMDACGLAEHFPWLNPDGVAAGTFGVSGEGWYDGYGLMQAFRRKARALGATMMEGEVTELDQEGGRITAVRLADGRRIGCGTLVDAAGARGARALARLAGVDLPIAARKRCVFTFQAEDALPGFPMIIDPTGTYVRPEGSGYICGVQPDADRDPDDPDFEVDWALFDDAIWPVLAARVPAFERIRPGRAWAGHYDMNLHDHNALVGRLPGLDNMLIAAGFSGHGLQQSPAVGRGVAELIEHGRFTSLDLSPFDPGRIARGERVVEDAIV